MQRLTRGTLRKFASATIARAPTQNNEVDRLSQQQTQSAAEEKCEENGQRLSRFAAYRFRYGCSLLYGSLRCSGKSGTRQCEPILSLFLKYCSQIKVQNTHFSSARIHSNVGHWMRFECVYVFDWISSFQSKLARLCEANEECEWTRVESATWIERDNKATIRQTSLSPKIWYTFNRNHRHTYCIKRKKEGEGEGERNRTRMENISKSVWQKLSLSYGAAYPNPYIYKLQGTRPCHHSKWSWIVPCVHETCSAIVWTPKCTVYEFICLLLHIRSEDLFSLQSVSP